jgi:oligoribonuclease NrnB/cAMP/cGMP phosphodiesterase (DHH superfamily)
MKVNLFSHGSDLDGIISAAIGLIRYPQAKVFFMDYSRENFLTLVEKVSLANNLMKKNIFIISDLGLNDSLIDPLTNVFIEVSKKKNDIIWVDHHPWSETAINKVKEIVELVFDQSGKKCASELMYERFLLGNERAEMLASLAHTMDFFTKDQYLTPISELIKYYLSFQDSGSRLLNLTLKISNGILWDLDMDKDYKKYSLLSDNDKKEALANIRRKIISGLDVVFVKSLLYLQTSLFSEEVFRITNADLAIFYDESGKISIRRNNEKIACNEIAAHLLYGGGHKYAAGGSIKKGSTEEDIITEIEMAISNTLKPKL